MTTDSLEITCRVPVAETEPRPAVAGVVVATLAEVPEPAIRFRTDRLEPAVAVHRSSPQVSLARPQMRPEFVLVQVWQF